jgi:predicted nucleic acid-binding protein
VRYWDASALVPLCVSEAATAAVRRLVPGGIVTWSVSAVEIAAAIERRCREGSLTEPEGAAARAALGELGPVRDRALRLVGTHALRAADAMQLGAALVAVSDHPRGHEFVCGDDRLRAAAARESFRVLP